MATKSPSLAPLKVMLVATPAMPMVGANDTVRTVPDISTYPPAMGTVDEKLD
jgi:hypothetical protein